MSSPLILSLSTIFALVGIVLVAIAFGTNDWQSYKVDRVSLLQYYRSDTVGRFRSQIDQLGGINNSDIMFDRTYGLFYECFPGKETPPLNEQYKMSVSPLGSMCINRTVDYQVPENRTQISSYSDEEKTRMHLLRTMVAFYIVGLLFLLICLFTGVSGCWKRSESLILVTGVLLLFATLFLAASMAVWHGVNYLTLDVITATRFYTSWPQLLQSVTSISYAWSYMISWIGIGFVLIASVLMLAAYRAMKVEDGTNEKQGYPMPAYDKQQAMVPYGYAYGYGAPAYPAGPYYGSYASNGYSPYGYLTYGRQS